MQPDILKEHIRSAFLDARFPEHCGVNAARARDEWVSDKRVLRRLTRKNDYRGPWWNVPDEHLNNSLGFNYLDPRGFEFYLPALMTLAINKPSYGVLSILAWELNPAKHDDDAEIYKHFKWRLSRIRGAKREACVSFLSYLSCLLQQFSAEDATGIAKAIEHPFWHG